MKVESMNSFLKKDIVKNSVIYVISNFINASIPFFLLPIMTTCLTPADYGITAMFQVVVAFMLPLVGVNTESAVSVEYYNNIFDDLGKYIGNCIILALCSFTLMMIIAFSLTNAISSLTEIPPRWLYLAFIQSFLQFFCMLALILWQVSKKAVRFGLFQILLSLTNATLSIWFVYYLGMNYQGRLSANFIAIVLFSVIAIIYIIRHYRVKFIISKKMMRDALVLGIPLIPHVLGGWALSMIDRILLANMISLDAVGKYSAAFQIASVMSFLTVAVNQAFVPWLFERLKNATQAIKKQIVNFSYIYMVGLCLCGALYIAVFPLLKRFMLGPKFSEIGITFTILVAGFVFQGFYMTFTNYITFIKRTKYQAIVTIIVGLVKIPLTYLLILQFGAIGAAIGYSLTFFFFFITTAFVSNKLYPMPWNIFRKSC